MKPKEQTEDSNSLFDFADWGGRPSPRYQRKNLLVAKLQKRLRIRKPPLR